MSVGAQLQAVNPPVPSQVESLYERYRATWREFEAAAADEDDTTDEEVTDKLEKNRVMIDQLHGATPVAMRDCCALLAVARDMLQRAHGDCYGNLPTDLTLDADNFIAAVQRRLLQLNDLDRQITAAMQRAAD